MGRFALAEWRKLKQYSQEDMADALNIHVNTYRAWENEPGRIKIDDAIRIAKILDVPFEDICFTAKSTFCGSEATK